MLFADETDALKDLRALLRRFVAEEMPPEKVQAWDREHRFPPELFRKLADLGVLPDLLMDQDFSHAVP